MKISLPTLLLLVVSLAFLTAPGHANEGFRKLCFVAQQANRDGASGKQEISAGLQKAQGWSRTTADRVTDRITREYCPGVW